MSDAHQRHLERQVAQGDEEAQEAILVARLRDGTLTQAKLKLAAFCGHKASRSVLGYSLCVYSDPGRLSGMVHVDELPLAEWLKSLSLATEKGDDCDPLDVGVLREERCASCRGTGNRLGYRDRVCNRCKGAGVLIDRWPQDDWLLRRAALQAGRLAQRELERLDSLVWDGFSKTYLRTTGGPVRNSLFDQATFAVMPSRVALDAQALYLTEGTPESHEVVMQTWHAIPQPVSLWLAHARENKAELIDTIQTAAWAMPLAMPLAGACLVRKAVELDLIKWAL